MQLQGMDEVANRNFHFVLGQDIDLSMFGSSFNPIGGITDDDALDGSLDGRNFVISNLAITSTASRVALFSTLSGGISNLEIVDAIISVTGTGSKYVGTLVGYQLADSVIENVIVSGAVSSSNSYSGGVWLVIKMEEEV